MSWGRILMIDENAAFRRMVSEYLAREGMEVISASRVDVFAINEAVKAHVVLLSTSTAEDAGTVAISRLRSLKHIPLLLISSAGDKCSEALAELAADELTKPFDIAELYKKLLSLLPQDISLAPSYDTAEYQSLRVDLSDGDATIDGASVGLSVKEAEILHLLISHPRHVFSREEIASHVWGRLLSDNSTITVHINHIRSKIGRYKKNIASVRGAGYMFKD